MLLENVSYMKLGRLFNPEAGKRARLTRVHQQPSLLRCLVLTSHSINGLLKML